MRVTHRRNALAVFMLFVLTLLSIVGILVFPDIWLTVLLGALGFLFVIAQPIWGIVIVLTLLYFPIFENISLGAVEISVSTIPVIGLGISALGRLRSQKAAGWHFVIILFLLFAFTLTTLTSRSISSSLRLLPNLIMYILIIFSMCVLLKDRQSLIFIGRAVIVFTILIIIWQEVLRTWMGGLGISLPTLGINGYVFEFHPMLGIGLVSLFVPVAGQNGAWRWLSIITLGLVVFVSVISQARSFWIADVVLVLFILLIARPKISGLPVFVGVMLFVVLSTTYIFSLQKNFQVTATSFSVLLGSKSESSMDRSDYIRLLAFEAGKKMFFDSPVIGQGPNQFRAVKGEYVSGPKKYVSGGAGGAFNSWMMVLGEMGILGFLAILTAFLSPVFILTVMLMRRRSYMNNEIFALVLGLVLGVVSLGIHLIFIDLLYGTFVWIFVGISMAAVEIVLNDDRVQSLPNRQTA